MVSYTLNQHVSLWTTLSLEPRTQALEKARREQKREPDIHCLHICVKLHTLLAPTMTCYDVLESFDCMLTSALIAMLTSTASA